MKVLVTGASGYLGRLLLERLADESGAIERIIGVDIRPFESKRESVVSVVADIRGETFKELVSCERPDVIVHLAAIVTPGADSTREFEYSVDVLGTRSVLDAALAGHVGRLIVSSSGAAYGYHADHPEWITEDAPIRGNEAFAYAWHKRLVEEMLADARREHPGLEQLVFRVSTILGRGTDNQITALFDKPRLVSVRGGDDRFVLVWDRDAAECFAQAVLGGPPGIYNLCGDGAITMAEMAHRLGKPYWRLPAWSVRAALALGKRLGLSRYGPEQVEFLRFRPVLSNAALKREFGFVPSKSSSDVFDYYLAHRHERD